MIKIESRTCINIRKIVEYLASDVATRLRQSHAVTECDTTTFLCSVAKLKFLKVSTWIRKTQAF